jgi:hypothetical protein
MRFHKVSQDYYIVTGRDDNDVRGHVMKIDGHWRAQPDDATEPTDVLYPTKEHAAVVLVTGQPFAVPGIGPAHDAMLDERYEPLPPHLLRDPHLAQRDPVLWKDAYGPFGRPTDCTDDHSSRTFCPVHGFDSSVPPPAGFRWVTKRDVLGYTFSVPVPESGRLDDYATAAHA